MDGAQERVNNSVDAIDGVVVDGQVVAVTVFDQSALVIAILPDIGKLSAAGGAQRH